MKNKLYPELRFKAENGKDYPEWKNEKLDKIFNSIRGNGLSKDDIALNGQYECVLYGELYTTYDRQIKTVISKTNKKTKNCLLSKKNDVLMPNSTTTVALDLINFTWLNKNDIILGGDITALRLKNEGDGLFFSYCLTEKKELQVFGQGSTIIHLNFNNIRNFELLVPSFLEQQKIANFFSSLDTQIDDVTKLLERTKELKKGYLQKIFNQELKFKDEKGKAYPEWEKKKLKDITKNIISNLTAVNSNNTGKFPIYDANEIVAYNEIAVVKEPYVTIIKDGAGAGRLRILPKNTSFTGTMTAFVGKEINTEFLYYLLLTKDFNKYKVGTTIPHIYYRDYKNEEMFVPIEQEQLKISIFFTSLDKKIEYFGQLLQKLQEKKKGYMQKMFI